MVDKSSILSVVVPTTIVPTNDQREDVNKEGTKNSSINQLSDYHALLLTVMKLSLLSIVDVDAG
jgi:hypothetical protein